MTAQYNDVRQDGSIIERFRDPLNLRHDARRQADEKASRTGRAQCIYWSEPFVGSTEAPTWYVRDAEEPTPDGALLYLFVSPPDGEASNA